MFGRLGYILYTLFYSCSNCFEFSCVPLTVAVNKNLFIYSEVSTVRLLQSKNKRISDCCLNMFCARELDPIQVVPNTNQITSSTNLSVFRGLEEMYHVLKKSECRLRYLELSPIILTISGFGVRIFCGISQIPF